MEIGFVCGRFIQLRCLRANGDYDWLVKTIQVGSKNKLFFGVNTLVDNTLLHCRSIASGMREAEKIFQPLVQAR